MSNDCGAPPVVPRISTVPISTPQILGDEIAAEQRHSLRLRRLALDSLHLQALRHSP